MVHFKLSKRKLLIALVLTRRVAAIYKPEIKLVTFLLTALIGNKFFDSETVELIVCSAAVARKYGWNLLSNG